ncbi:armadillo repeat-containing protein 3-like [Anticarsia gemmatalis]|uniref:armadillo repeat-containing protein 3-like n=1 Tax=Anticarsia gemmatalis TaxID=129554 RepID=UPI003F7710BA
MRNRTELLKLNAPKYLLHLLDHPEINIRRFTLKALAQLCELPEGPEHVLKDPQNMMKVALQIVKVEDVFVLEFASLLLSELTLQPRGCTQLYAANILGSLFSRMKNSLDPDVQKNCLQTLSNLLNDPVCATAVTKNPQFSWPSLTALAQSKFLAIQRAALKTIVTLICRYDKNLQKSFRSTTGLFELCEIIESYEFRDVHPQVLDLLRHYVKEEENASFFYETGCVQRLLMYLHMALPQMKPCCLAVLTQMSMNKKGRDALFETEVDLEFCEQLLSSDVALLADAALGVSNMTKLLPSAIRMSNTNIIQALCAILEDDAAVWFNVRINALRALVKLCRIIPKAAFSLVDPKTFAALRSINQNYNDSPIQAQRLSVQVYRNLLNYYMSAKGMLNEDFMLELLGILQRPDITLKMMTCTVFTTMMDRDVAKDLFTSCHGESVISKSLRIDHVGLRTSLCEVIIASVTTEGAEKYLQLGTIHYMVENKRIRYVVNTWEPALKAIFRQNPSAKLAYIGRLDIDDFTTDGFYCLKRLSQRFPTLHEVTTTPALCKNPVIICTFNRPDWMRSEDEHSNESINRRSVKETIPSLRFLNLPDDVDLRDHLLKLKMWLGDSKSYHYKELEEGNFEVTYRDRCDEVSTSLKHKAHLIAEYVTGQMNGLGQRDCSMPCVELHLADLMVELNSPIINIGRIKCGGSLERAILYKILADRLAVPCSLHRATSAHAWCEVAVPDVDADDKDGEENYPAGLLRANYVVDLLMRPGRLLPLGGREARLICGPKTAPPYTTSTISELKTTEVEPITILNPERSAKLLYSPPRIGQKA